MGCYDRRAIGVQRVGNVGFLIVRRVLQPAGRPVGRQQDAPAKGFAGCDAPEKQTNMQVVVDAASKSSMTAGHMPTALSIAASGSGHLPA
jgi:hypothetical protein